ncbi:hypothetical protein COO60DRAFT_762101 [Scenedesmus sp. NREL 46B-D3]|nr:hypothetical protein COO60DRAFT_762101 [Scenedesmus sp. NREL 46B-D3]
MLYRSPLQRVVISLKVSKAPGEGSEVHALLQQQLAAAIEASVLAASAAAADTAGSAPAGQQAAVIVTGVAAFPGCWQLVMHLVLPPGQLSDGQLQQLQQQVQHAAQGVLDAYPPDCILLSTQLQPVMREVVAAATLPVTVPAAVMQAAAAAPADVPVLVTAAGGAYMHPVAAALPDCGCSSNSSGSEASHATDASAVVEVCISQATVVQLLQAGHSSVRVVVTSQLPGAPALVDEIWQLPSAEAPSSSSASPGGGVAPSIAADVRWPIQLQLGSFVGMHLQQQQQQQEPLVMSVVILAGRTHDAALAGVDPAAAAAAAASGGATDASSQHVPAAVLAKLPLLLLPAGATAELQELYTWLAAGGMQPAAVYHELLPLLQDLAVVLSSSGSSTANHLPGSAGAEQQHDGKRGLLQVLVSALLECCQQQGLPKCTQLLQSAGAAPAAVEFAGNQSGMAQDQAIAEQQQQQQQQQQQ